MKTHNIPLESFIPKGKLSIQAENGELRMLTLEEGLSKKRRSYVTIPGTFTLPFRIDVTLKTNSPQFKFQVGKGHILFTGSLNRSGSAIRRADIFTGNEETTKYDIDHVMPINEYVDISVVYGIKMMWVELNGQPCYYTGKAPYISLLENNDIPEELAGGLGFAIACAEKVELLIKSFSITEYEQGELPIPKEIAEKPELSAFEWYLKSLPHEVREEVIKTDAFLMKDMKKSLSFKKSIDKDGKLTYASPCGFHYTLRRYGIGEPHVLVWNKYWNDASHEVRWAGNFGGILEKIAKTSPDFADKMFDNIQEHIGGQACMQCASTSCANMAVIHYNGRTKRACSGNMQFKWQPSEFNDVRRMIEAVGDYMKKG